LVSRPTVIGLKTNSYWSQDQQLLVSRPTVIGLKTNSYWSQDQQLLASRPTAIGFKTNNFIFLFNLKNIKKKKMPRYRDDKGRFIHGTEEFGSSTTHEHFDSNEVSIKVPGYSYFPFFCLLFVLLLAMFPYFLALPSITKFLMRNLAISMLDSMGIVIVPNNTNTTGSGFGGT